MTRKCSLLISVFAIVQFFAGCAASGGGPTGPANAPILSNSRVVNQQPVNPGATIIFLIDFVDPNGDLNGGAAVITDNQGSQPYNGFVSNANGTSGTLTTSLDLSSLASSGDVTFSIYVVDLAGNPSNPVYVMVTIL